MLDMTPTSLAAVGSVLYRQNH